MVDLSIAMLVYQRVNPIGSLSNPGPRGPRKPRKRAAGHLALRRFDGVALTLCESCSLGRLWTIWIVRSRVALISGDMTKYPRLL